MSVHGVHFFHFTAPLPYCVWKTASVSWLVPQSSQRGSSKLKYKSYHVLLLIQTLQKLLSQLARPARPCVLAALFSTSCQRSLSLGLSTPATVAVLLSLLPVSGPLHLLFFLPGMFYLFFKVLAPQTSDVSKCCLLSETSVIPFQHLFAICQWLGYLLAASHRPCTVRAAALYHHCIPSVCRASTAG